MNNETPPDGGARLRAIVNRTAELTPLRSVATRAIQLAEDERSAALDLATVISSDQALTAKLLRLSNSAYYGHSRRISTVREAVVLLGMRTVRSVAIASGVIDALKTPVIAGFEPDLFWAHAICVGLVAEQIARETKGGRPEDAFTVGVLHDMGKLAMLIAEPTTYAVTVRRVLHEGMSYREAELSAFGVSHQLVGARLAARWRFPDHLCAAIRTHHPARIPASLDQLSDIVAVADHACNRAGLAAGFDFTTSPERWPIGALPGRAERAIAALQGIDAIQERGRAFLLHVSSRTPRWYGEEPCAAVESCVA